MVQRVGAVTGLVVGVVQSVLGVGLADRVAPAGKQALLCVVAGSQHRSAGDNTEEEEELDSGSWAPVVEGEMAALVRQVVEAGPVMLQAMAGLERKEDD